MLSSPLVGSLQASLGFSFNRFGGKLPSTPGEETSQEFNVQVLSRRWYPSPKPAIGSTISVVGGLHSANGGALQSGAITITAATRYLNVMVMSHATLYLESTEATVLWGANSAVFTATTMADPSTTPDPENDQFNYTFPFILE